MSKSFSSEHWTGLSEERLEMAGAPQEQETVGSPTKRWTKEGVAVAGLSSALILSPVIFVLSYATARGAIPDWPAAGSDPYLLLASLPFAVGFAQFCLGFDRWLMFRRTPLILALIVTLAAAAIYPLRIIQIHASAVAAAPERAFEMQIRSGRRIKQTDAVFVRENGSIVGNESKGIQLEHGTSCALVQRLSGSHGFTWVRVLDRSRQPTTGQLSWGISRNDCFSSVPLSQLPR